ncbi:hypothetical protein [Mesorhizobium carmichaelinearum]|uniref:hypothetical protein n=1 Tax=Mesorhizobium carmichaelinearum TaxID=1208188 RepID=UPI000BA31570|nr:hypothetical protein [Mesorhizobium carmichaelinearum]
MKTGRPPSWNPVASLGRAVWTDVLPLASKGRVVLPVFVRAQFDWLSVTGSTLLAVVEAGARAEILPWVPHGERAITDLQSMIDMAEERDKDELALAAMDRFFRMSIDAAGRTILPSPLASYLDAETAGCVRVVMRNSRLWFWSERTWQAERAKRVALLAMQASTVIPSSTSDSNTSIRQD